MKRKINIIKMLLWGLILILAFSVLACDEEDPVCECPNGTAHEPEDFPCCEGLDCDCVIAEPAVKEFKDQVMFVDNTQAGNYYADIIDTRTQAGSKTLEDLDIITKLQDAIAAGYAASGAAAKGRFRNVFEGVVGKATITIENNVNYETYDADNRTNVRFNIDYLLSVDDADLQTVIITMVAEMRNLPYAEISKSITRDVKKTHMYQLPLFCGVVVDNGTPRVA